MNTVDPNLNPIELDSTPGLLPTSLDGLESLNQPQSGFSGGMDLLYDPELVNVDNIIPGTIDSVTGTSSPDLVISLFDVQSDHILAGKTIVDFTLQNLTSAAAGNFGVNFVYSDDDIIGNSDDVVVGTRNYNGLSGNASLSDSVDLQLPVATLNSNAQRDDGTSHSSGYVSSSRDFIGIVIDPNNQVQETNETNNFNQGQGRDKDDITYFPWDVNGSGSVTATDAIFIINRLGESLANNPNLDMRADVNGSGSITATDAIAVINRLGYVRNDIVMNDPHSPYITVTSPNSGNTLQTGNNYNITWDDNISENVKIELYKGGVFNQTIFSSTASDGVQSWTVPTNLTSGSDYQIKISSLNNSNIQDVSNSYFTINSSNEIDLVGTSLTNNESLLKAGESYNFNFGVQNTGTGNASSFNVGFYLSKDTNINSSDYFLSSYSISSLGAGATTNLSQNLILPNADDTFWNGQGTYYIGMIVDSGNSITETNETNNNTRYNSTLISSFNIEFDYTYDSIGWYDSAKRASLEAAADIWERIILDEFANTPSGTNTPFVRNPETDQYLGTNNTYTTTSLIDDLKIFVGARDLSGSTLGEAGSSGFYTNETRYTGDDFEPWIGSLTFDPNANWFIDSTPEDSSLNFDQSDFISVAVHEIAHILGFTSSTNAFERWISNSTFTGTNAKSYNGGNAIPLIGSHIQDGYTYSNYGENAMDPVIMSGTRKLPTILDIAILDDIGYSVNYGAAYYN